MKRIKKTLSLSLLTLLAAPPLAGADSNNTTLYGQTRLSVDSVDNDKDRVLKVADTESRLGVKGFELIGNGLKAVFQLEVAVNLDDGTGPVQWYHHRSAPITHAAPCSLGPPATILPACRYPLRPRPRPVSCAPLESLDSRPASST